MLCSLLQREHVQSDRFGNCGANDIGVRFVHVELDERRGVEIKNQIRSSSTISEASLSPGFHGIGFFAPFSLPPLPGRTQGSALMRRMASASSSLAVGSTSVSRATGLPRSVITTSLPVRTSFRYFDRPLFIFPIETSMRNAPCSYMAASVGTWSGAVHARRGGSMAPDQSAQAICRM